MEEKRTGHAYNKRPCLRRHFSLPYLYFQSSFTPLKPHHDMWIGFATSKEKLKDKQKMWFVENKGFRLPVILTVWTGGVR